MCVALPARIEWIGERTAPSTPARVVLGETELSVDLVLVPEAAVGDSVIVHSGYAIAVVSADVAAETRALFDG